MNDIEEKFYKTFGIEKQKYYVMQDVNYKDVFEEKLPPITDRILLELICIYNKFLYVNPEFEDFYSPMDYNKAKGQILYWLVEDCAEDKKVKNQVQSLFKGGE